MDEVLSKKKTKIHLLKTTGYLGQTAVESFYTASVIILNEEWILHFASIFTFVGRTWDKYCH